jgi:hypothetical protein
MAHPLAPRGIEVPYLWPLRYASAARGGSLVVPVIWRTHPSGLSRSLLGK